MYCMIHIAACWITQQSWARDTAYLTRQCPLAGRKQFWHYEKKGKHGFLSLWKYYDPLDRNWPPLWNPKYATDQPQSWRVSLNTDGTDAATATAPSIDSTDSLSTDSPSIDSTVNRQRRRSTAPVIKFCNVDWGNYYLFTLSGFVKSVVEDHHADRQLDLALEHFITKDSGSNQGLTKRLYAVAAVVLSVDRLPVLSIDWVDAVAAVVLSVFREDRSWQPFFSEVAMPIACFL